MNALLGWTTLFHAALSLELLGSLCTLHANLRKSAKSEHVQENAW